MKILFVNKNLNLSVPIIRELREISNEVDVLIEQLPEPLDKKNLYHRTRNIFSRIFLKDSDYFSKAEKRKFREFAEKQFLNKPYDIAFIIRADMYSDRLLKKIRQKTVKMVSFQWDGIDIYPKILEYYKYFDRKLVFDPTDISKFSQYGLLPLPNYHYAGDLYGSPLKSFDLFYVGVGLDERISWTKNLEKYCIENGLKIHAILTIPPFREEKHSGMVHLQHTGISLDENEKFSKISRAIIDFRMASHRGLSFRFFECLNRNQKLVTNNNDIRYYEFYHPDNIFVTDFEDFTGLQEFLQKPYHKLDRKMVEKYGIKNWLRYALDLPPYTPLSLPEYTP